MTRGFCTAGTYTETMSQTKAYPYLLDLAWVLQYHLILNSYSSPFFIKLFQYSFYHKYSFCLLLSSKSTCKNAPKVFLQFYVSVLVSVRSHNNIGGIIMSRNMVNTPEDQSSWKCFLCIFKEGGHTIFGVGNNSEGLFIGLAYKVKSVSIKKGVAEIEIVDFHNLKKAWIIKLSKEATTLNKTQLSNLAIGENFRLELTDDIHHKNNSVEGNFTCKKYQIYLGDGYLTF